jgi:hypothetical protein
MRDLSQTLQTLERKDSLVPEDQLLAQARREQMKRDIDHGKFYMKENSKMLSRPPLPKPNARPKLQLSRGVLKLQISNQVFLEDESLNDRMQVHEDPFAVKNEKCI